jgi:hypothetical protein
MITVDVLYVSHVLHTILTGIVSFTSYNKLVLTSSKWSYLKTESAEANSVIMDAMVLS